MHVQRPFPTHHHGAPLRDHRRRDGAVWTAIARFTKKLHARRSALLQGVGVGWLDALAAVRQVVVAACGVVLSAQLLSDPAAPLCTLAPRMRRFPSLKRAVVAVVSLVRWRAAVARSLKSSGVAVVDFVSAAVDAVTAGLTDVSDVSLRGPLDGRWAHLVGTLRAATDSVGRFAEGVATAVDAMRETPYSTMKCDILSALAVAWRDRMHADEQLHIHPTAAAAASAGPVAAPPSLCCTDHHRRQRATALRGMETLLCDVVSDFALTFPASAVGSISAAELTYFSLVINVLQLWVGRPTHVGRRPGAPLSGLCNTALPVGRDLVRSLRSIFVAIDEKALDVYNQSMDEKPANNIRSRAVSRDRHKSLRRVCHTLVALLQVGPNLDVDRYIAPI